MGADVEWPVGAGAGLDPAMALDRLADVEATMAGLYEWLARVYADDTEARALFCALAREELGHRDLVNFQSQIVRRNRSAFPPIRIDQEALAGLSQAVAIFREQPAPSLAAAVAFVLGLEGSAAEAHYRTALAGANPELGKLIQRLGREDDGHVGRLRSFAAARGLL
jgi:rubrerythrin